MDVLWPDRIESLVQPLLAFLSVGGAWTFSKWYRPANSLVWWGVAMLFTAACVYAGIAAVELWSGAGSREQWAVGIVAGLVAFGLWAWRYQSIIAQMAESKMVPPRVASSGWRHLAVAAGLVPLVWVAGAGAIAGGEDDVTVLMAGLGGDTAFESAVKSALSRVEGIPPSEVAFTPSGPDAPSDPQFAARQAQERGASVAVFGGLSDDNVRLYAVRARGGQAPRVPEYTRENDDRLAHDIAFTVVMLLAVGDMEEEHVDYALARIDHLSQFMADYAYYNRDARDDAYNTAIRAYLFIESGGYLPAPAALLLLEADEDRTTPLLVARGHLGARVGSSIDQAEDDLLAALGNDPDFGRVNGELALLYAVTNRWCEASWHYAIYDQWLLGRNEQLTREEANAKDIAEANCE